METAAGSLETRLLHLCEVATVVVQLEVVQVDDVSGDCVEEVSVVGHHYQRLLPALQILLRSSQTVARQADLTILPETSEQNTSR